MIMKKIISVMLLCASLSLVPLPSIADPVIDSSTKSLNIPTDTQQESQTVPAVLHGNVTVDIHQYCENWTSEEAYNVINRIGNRLITANNVDKNIKFKVIDTDVANAYANLKDEIAVYKGLLKYVETEDELAYVIAHEMGHVYKGHVKKGVIRRGVISVIAVTGAVLVALGEGSQATTKKAQKAAADSAVSVAATTVMIGGFADKTFTRGQETCADLTGVDFMVKAGYNPLASISILNKISGNYFDLFSDHPSGTKRIKKAYKHISQNYPEYIIKGYDSESYNRALQIIKPKEQL